MPELLVSLCILLLLLQMSWQWGQLTINSEERVQQNQQAILLANMALAGAQPDLQDGWSVSLEEKPGNLLLEQKVKIAYKDQQWNFYYAGKPLDTANEE